jgi:hypothetical protein
MELDNNNLTLNINADFEQRKQTRIQHATINQPIYIDFSQIPATSCSTERLFSKARFMLHYTRANMSLEHFECQMYLKENREYWDLLTVARAMW